MIKNKIVEVGNTQWMIRQAKSMNHALDAIAEARVTGSIGVKDIVNNTACGGIEEVVADVVKLSHYNNEES